MERVAPSQGWRTSKGFAMAKDESSEVRKETSFDFEQEDGAATNSDDDDEESAGWGSEFEGNSDFDELDVQADTTGQMNGVDLMHKAFWEKLTVIDDNVANSDPTGRYKYVRGCQDADIRPSVSVLLALSKDMMMLQNHGLRACDVVALAAGIEQNSTLAVVNLSGNRIAGAGEALGRAFQQNCTVEHLVLRGAHLDVSLGRHLAISLKVNTTLTHIDVASNRIGDEGVACLLAALNRYVLYVGVSDNQAGSKAARAIGRMLPRNTSLKTLDLSWNHLRARDIEEVAEAVQYNAHLSTLSLAWNGIGDVAPEPEAESEQVDEGKEPKGKSSRHRMKQNSGEEPHKVVTMITKNKFLTDLDLSQCRIGCVLAKDLAGAIAKNTSLKRLNLDSNPCGEAMSALLAALRQRQIDDKDFKYMCDKCTFDVASSSTALYDLSNPSGHYVLDLSLPNHQEVAKSLVKDAKSSNGEFWRCEKLNGIRFNFPTLKSAKWPVPTQGTLELHLCYSDGLSHHEKSAHPEDFRKLYKVLQNSPSDSGRLNVLKRACQAYFFDVTVVVTILMCFDLGSTREMALVTMLNKITKQNKLFSVLGVFSDASRVNLHKRLGALWFWNDASPAGLYWLDLGKKDDQTVMLRLLAYRKEHDSKFKDVRFTADPAKGLVEKATIQDIMERNEAGSDRLPEVGILSFDFVIESPPKENSLDELMLQSENLQKEMQRLEAEADQVVSSRPVTTTRRRSRPPTGDQDFFRKSSQSSRPVSVTGGGMRNSRSRIGSRAAGSDADSWHARNAAGQGGQFRETQAGQFDLMQVADEPTHDSAEEHENDMKAKS